MENVLEILTKYKEKGIRISLDGTGDNLSIKGELSVLSELDKVELRFCKDALLSFLQSQKTVTLSRTTLEKGRLIALSPAQKGIWFHSRIEDNDTMYMIPAVYDLNVPGLDQAGLFSAAEVLVAAHPILSCVFGEKDGEPHQELKELTVTNHLFFEDLSDYSESEKELQSAERINSSMKQGFDFSSQSPWSITVFDLGDNQYRFFVKIHHLIADGATLGLLVEGIVEAYHLLETGNTYQYNGVHYHDYVSWITDKSHQRHSSNFWKTYLNNYPEDLQLPEMSHHEETGSVTTIELPLPTALREKTTQFTISKNLSLSQLFVFSFGLVLSKNGRQDDVIIGTPVEGRIHPELQKVLGDFVNTVPIRLQLDFKLSTLDNLHLFSKGYLNALEHQQYPFEFIMDDIGYQRQADRFPLFNTMVSFPNNQKLGSKNRDELKISKDQSMYDLTLSVLELTDCTEMQLEFDKKKFSFEYASGILEQTLIVLDQVVNFPENALTEVSLIRASEQKKYLDKGLPKSNIKQINSSIMEVVTKIISNNLAAVAVVEGGSKYSYAALQLKSQAIAWKLQEKELKQGDRVIVELPAGFDLLASMLGIWQMGGVYVPIGTDLPANRKEEVVFDSGAVISIDAAFIASLSQTTDRYVELTGDNLSYILYTSGSSGKPKGVAVTHGALLNKMNEEATLLNTRSFNSLTLTSPTFDVSLLELVLPLTLGGLVIVQQEKSNSAVFESILQNKVTVLQGTPTYFSHLESELEESVARYINETLELLCIGGESLNDALVKRLKKKLPKVQINNHYGPTEITIDALAKQDVLEFKSNSLGNTFGNTGAIIVDDYANVLPENVPGELLITGPSLAEGYWNNSTETEAKFPTIGKLGLRVYKTGDLAYWSKDGEIQFIGRSDKQIKFRGYRIELEEINARLREIAGVRDAYTLVMSNVLVSWIAADMLNESKIREHLQQTLPEYMIPTVYQQLDFLPMNASGKVDDKHLPQPSSLRTEYVAPRNELESQLVEIWQEVLGVQRVGIYDNFFELGGHSLKLLTLQGRITQQLGLLSLKELATTPIRFLSEKLVSKQQVGNVTRHSFDKKAEYPVLDFQEQMWYASKTQNGSSAYTIPFSIKLADSFPIESIRHAFHTLIERHEILRTVFFSDESGKIRQRVCSLEECYLKVPSEVEVKDSSNKRISGLNIEEGRQISLDYGKVVDGHRNIEFQIHHIVADSESVEIIKKEFLSILTDGKNLPELEYQHSDIVLSMDNQDNSLQNSEVGKEIIQSTRIPTENKSNKSRTFRGKVRYASIDPEGLKRLANVTGKVSVSFSLLSTLWKIILHKYTQEMNIVLGTTVSLRNDPRFNGQIGPYMKTVPFHSKVSSENTFKTLLTSVQEQLLQTVDDAQRGKNSESNPISIFISEQHIPIGTDPVPEVCSDHFDSFVKFDLAILHYYNSDQHIIELAYDNELYDQFQMNSLIEHFKNTIESIINSPNKSINELSILSPEEIERIVSYGNGGQHLSSGKKTVLDHLDMQIRHNPENIAVKQYDRTLSYSELERQSNLFASFLTTKGITENSIVSVELSRNLNLIVTLFGILKKGCAYAPIDKSFPDERKLYIRSNSGSVFAITDEVVDEFLTNSNHYSNCVELPKVASEQLAYIIYTSGTTGQPKGVMVSHQNLLNFAENAWNQLHLKDASCTSAITNYCFDISILELICSIAFGVKTILFSESTIDDPFLLLKEVGKENIDYLQLTPSRFRQFDQIGDFPETLKFLLVGGELISDELYKKLAALEQCVIQVYGPTETTIWSSSMTIKSADESNIGTPLPGERFYIMDAHQNLMPEGIPGEIVIAGEGVSLGYMNNENLTSEKFIQNPYYLGGPSYRTGDYGYYTSSGKLKFIGRKDNQVKWNGYRIELNEIQNSLNTCPKIKTGVVFVVEKHGRMDLVAVVVGNIKDKVMIRNFLAEKLPNYMLPSVIHFMDELPLNHSGKIDFNTLKKINFESNTNATFVPPTSSDEKLIAGIWSELLRYENISVHDNYFSLGGTSISAIKLVQQITEQFNVDIKLHDIYSNPTVLELTEWVLNQNKIKGNDAKTNSFLVNNSVRIIWEILKKQPTINDAYAFKYGYILFEPVELGTIRTAVEQFSKKHPLTKSSLIERENGIEYDFSEEVLIKELKVDSSTNLSELIGSQKTIQPLDNDNLIQWTLCHSGDKCVALLISSHAILLDGWSMGIIPQDLMALILNENGTEESVFQPPFRTEVNNTYWDTALKGKNLRISYDNISEINRSPVKKIVGIQESIHVTSVISEAIGTSISELRVSEFSFFLSLVSCALHEYTQQQEYCIATTFFGREDAQSQLHFGLLASSVPIVSTKLGTEDEISYVKKMFPIHLEAMKNQQQFGIGALQLKNWEGHSGSHPYFDVSFVWNFEDTDSQAPTLYRLEFDNKLFSRHDLFINGRKTKDGYTLNILFDDEKFNHQSRLKLINTINKQITKWKKWNN